ncbi:MAG: cupin domain-containing protein [Candidatus Neomarinimicrobiota bacterium]
MDDSSFFPGVITSLPPADIPIDGLSSYLVQGKDSQIIFMSFEKEAMVGVHTHAAQWCVVLDGQIELTVDGQKRVYGKGETYFIPANVPHGAKIFAGYKDVTLFGQKDRYKERTI